MAIDKILGNGDLDRVADSVFSAVNDSVSEIKAMQKRKAAENVQVVIQALKKIDADIREKYDGVTTVIEKRVATIKDGKDGKDGRDGTNGRDGKDGRPGRDGAVGPRGADGRNGRDGTDGVSVTDANIDFDGSLIISLSNGRTINVGEVVAPDLAERIKVITNGGGTSQGVLDTLTSLQDQINALVGLGAVNYVGTWDASTNSPTIVAGTGDKGDYYVVSVAGSTSIDGQTLWGVGDWIIFNGAVWQRVDGGSTGNFTTLTTSGTVTLNGGTANSVAYLNGSKVLTTGSALTFDGVNLGVGTAPSYWGADYRNIDINGSSSIGATLDQLDIGYNFYHEDYDNNDIYKMSKGAARYTQRSPGQHVWYVAPVGTAGDGLSFTQVMMIDQSANLKLGNGFPTAKLDVDGTAKVSGNVTLSGGTANGVAYLNGSKVLTTGSALTFDGTNFLVGVASLTPPSVGTTAPWANVSNGNNGALLLGPAASGTAFWHDNGGDTVTTIRNLYASTSANAQLRLQAGFLTFHAGTALSEQMRLTSTGLGIGTSSPAYKLDVQSTGYPGINVASTSASGNNGAFIQTKNGGGATSILGTETISGGYSYTGAIANSAYVGALGANPLQLITNSVARATLDSSGNLGLGVTPSASTLRMLQGPNAEFVVAARYPYIASNATNNGGWKYTNTEAASFYVQATGQHQWFIAPSGTAGNAISFTQAMTLDASGNLLLGATSGSSKLVVGSGSGSTATPTAIQMDNTYGTAAFDKLKFYLFKGASESYGFGLGALAEVQYWAGSSSTGTHVWYTSQTERARIDSSGNLIQTVNTTAATLATNNTLTFSIVDNSTLRISVRGSDGTTRTATVALS